MSIIPQVSQAMQSLLTTTTETVAATLQYVKRPDKAKFTPSTLVQTLVYGWLAQPTATVEQLAQMAARLGVDVSPQALDQRFTPATAALLQQVLAASIQHAIVADPVAIPILQRLTSVRIHDSTTIGLPDALTTTWRGHRWAEMWRPGGPAHRRDLWPRSRAWPHIRPCHADAACAAASG